jgi:hypothetical protein
MVAPFAGVRSVITGAEVEADHEGPLIASTPQTSAARTIPGRTKRLIELSVSRNTLLSS